MLRATLLSLSALLIIVCSSSAQVPPEKAISTMKVADDLQVELFASEPMFVNPTSIDIDHKGRVWVCEAVNYRQQLRGKPPIRKEGDRIVVLIDKTGEGKATEAVTFYQAPEVQAPMGVAVAPNADGKGMRVFVAQSPNIWVFEDKEGKLKADGPPKVLLKGFGGIDHDHGVHGLNIGPDGKLYFTVGDQGVKDLQSSDGKGRKWTSNGTDCRAGTVWRCDLDGTNLELIAHNFRNNYECCVNSFGEIWLSDNDDDGNQQTRICYVMPGGNYGYHPRGPGQSHWHEEQPGIVHKVLRTGFGSPTGICFYEGNLLPERFRGELLHCDAGPREVRRFKRIPKGAGFELEKEVILTSSDNWFRPSDVCVAPDGSVFVADWYDPGVGGHGMGDWTRGRIYRITPKGHKGYKVPSAQVDSVEKMAKTLDSPCLSTRALVGDAIRRKSQADFDADYWGSSQVALIPARGILFNHLDSPPNRTMGLEDAARLSRAILLYSSAPQIDAFLAKLKQRDEKMITNYMALITSAGLVRAGSEFRGFLGSGKKEVERPRDRFISTLGPAISLMRTRGTSIADVISSNKDTGDYEKEFIDWKNGSGDYPLRLLVPFSRELLLVLRNETTDFVHQCFYPLAKLYDGQDRFYLSALNIACGTDPSRREAILADFEKQFPEWNDKVADLVWELQPKSMLPKMEALLSDPKLTPTQKSRIVDILAAADDLSAGKSLLTLLTKSPNPQIRDSILQNLKLFLPGKWNKLRMSPELTSIASSLMNDPATAIAGLGLVAAANRNDMLERIESIIGKKEMPLDVRQTAVLTLGAIGNDNRVAILESLLKDAELAPKAVEALGMVIQEGGRKQTESTKEALKLLTGAITNKQFTDLHSQIISVLAGTRLGTQFLITAKEKNQLPGELVSEAGRFARNTPHQDLRNRALIAFPATMVGRLDPKKLPPIAELIKRTGDPVQGKQVLLASIKGEAQCMRCHMVRGVGGAVGPDLSMIGKKASKENLYESIFTPSKAIADQYIQWIIQTESGETISGLLVGETETDVTLRDANGKDTKIPVKSIENRKKSLVSLMPENLVAALSEPELIDLVEYLMTLKTASLTPSEFHIVGPFANDDSDSGLKLAYPPEKGPIDLGAKYKGKSGDVAWKTVKPNGAGYFDLKAHYEPKSAMIASYLYQTIESPKDQSATLLLGHDDGMVVWVNGKEIYRNAEHNAAIPEMSQVSVPLKKGPNQILLKIVNGDGDHGFYFALTSEEELKVAGKR